MMVKQACPFTSIEVAGLCVTALTHATDSGEGSHRGSALGRGLERGRGGCGEPSALEGDTRRSGARRMEGEHGEAVKATSWGRSRKDRLQPGTWASCRRSRPFCSALGRRGGRCERRSDYETWYNSVSWHRAVTPQYQAAHRTKCSQGDGSREREQKICLPSTRRWGHGATALLPVRYLVCACIIFPTTR